MSYSLSKYVYLEQTDEYDPVSIQDAIQTDQDLVTSLKKVQDQGIELYNILITEYDDEDIDAYGCPEILNQIDADEWMETKGSL